MKQDKLQVTSVKEQSLPSWSVVFFSGGEPLSQERFLEMLEEVPHDLVVLADRNRMSEAEVNVLCRQYCRQEPLSSKVAYLAGGESKLWLGCIRNLWAAAPEIVYSPVLIGSKSAFRKAYGGTDLAGNVLAGVGYSLQKVGGMKFLRLNGNVAKTEDGAKSKWALWWNYTCKLPVSYLFSGMFFKQMLRPSGRVQRDMVFRFLMVLFACFAFVFMPYISRDYGVTGDEFVDHRHAGYVLDYFAKGDKAALNQPQTALHLYGNTVQVITAAICRWFDVENYYELRHFFGGLVGAVGVLAVGLLGLRWGGGLCGLLAVLMMFFTPRFFGHSMNNLKDVPFAVGYVLALFYTVRLFDYFPAVRLRHLVGLVLGIALALGTRSGGLILYPMLFMYAGLYYISQSGGIREFYHFGKHRRLVGQILQIVILTIFISYILAISLWPFALANPLQNVIYSLTKFTNYNVGLRTIFDGEQMMSNMLPWQYAPKYLCIGMPIVILIGFFAYFIYAAVRKKEFSLIGFFLFFAAVFPVFWVIYQNSNLYGGIRHLLFVMPPMVVLAARFWSGMVDVSRGVGKVAVALVFALLLALPAAHMVRNHPNDYVYFNEFKGGLKGAYGDYETDYYFNSLKESADWFKEHVLPSLPKDKKTIISTQAINQVAYYFRKDTNIKVSYCRYYEKYAKDWDYAMFGNVYVNDYQLKNGLFPIEGTLYTPLVDGFPMSFVAKRDTKLDLQGFQLEQDKEYDEALRVFEEYLTTHPKNEEVWSRMGKLYYTEGDMKKAQDALSHALALQPALNEALYVSTLVNIAVKNYPVALQMVGRMLADNEFSADAWYLQASVYYHMKNYQSAINSLNRLLAFRPNFDRAHVLAGDIFCDHGDYRKALQLYETAAKCKQSGLTIVKMADMLARLKMYPQANGLLDQILKMQPDYYPALKVKCRMALQEGKREEAARYLKGMDAVADDPELFVLRALYYDGVDRSLALQMLQRALELDEGNAEALRLKNQKRL